LSGKNKQKVDIETQTVKLYSAKVGRSGVIVNISDSFRSKNLHYTHQTRNLSNLNKNDYDSFDATVNYRLMNLILCRKDLRDDLKWRIARGFRWQSTRSYSKRLLLSTFQST
jgi:hypothetical protein